MTEYGATGPIVIGQPMSPFFGAQNGNGKAATASGAAPIIPSPLPGTNIGPQVTALEAQARGALPTNALVNTVNGVSVGGSVSVIGSDPATVAQTFSNGNGQETMRGTNIGPNGALNQQVFVDGIATSVGASATGPAATNTASLVEAPVSAATLLSNVAVISQQYGG